VAGIFNVAYSSWFPVATKIQDACGRSDKEKFFAVIDPQTIIKLSIVFMQALVLVY
jgi:hypothetical protein